MPDLPLIDGFTQDARDTRAIATRVEAALLRRKGGSSGKIKDARRSLQDALNMESNSTMRGRIRSSLTMLERGTEGFDFTD